MSIGVLKTSGGKEIEDFDELEFTVEAARNFVEHSDHSAGNDFFNTLDRLQGDAKTQGKAQYLVITVKP